MDLKSSNFFSPQSPFWNKPAQKVRLVGIKRIFLKKVAFYTFDPSSFFVFFNAYSCVCVWEKERWEGFLRSLLKDASIAASTARHTLLFLMISFLRFSFHFPLPHYLSYNVMLRDAFLCFVHVWLSCVTIFVYNVKGRPFRPLLINLLQDLI